MIPQKQRASIWETANKLYPTFADLLGKVQEMVQDDLDNKNGVGPMDIDVVEQEGEWVNTGQTLTGKGANGEDTIFLLQRRGSAMRVTPKGKGKGARKGGGGAQPIEIWGNLLLINAVNAGSQRVFIVQ